MARAAEEGVMGCRVERKVVRWVRSLSISLLLSLLEAVVVVVVEVGVGVVVVGLVVVDGTSRTLQIRTINGINGA